MSNDYEFLTVYLLVLILKAQLAQLELLKRLVEPSLPVFRPPDLVFQPSQVDNR